MKQFIIDQTDIQASIAVVLGSGMGGFCDQMDDVILIPYKNIPNYPKSTVRGHAGELAIGSLDNIPLLAAKGRFHFYEGYDIQTITLPIQLFHSLGIKSLIINIAILLPEKKHVILTTFLCLFFSKSVPLILQYQNNLYLR